MAGSQHRSFTPPRAQSFVVCREIFEDCRSHHFILVAPMCALVASGFPFNARVSIYAYLTSGHGDYEVALQLRDADETGVWDWQCPNLVALRDPLKSHELALYDAILPFRAKGRYDLVMLVNGEELARHVLQVAGAPTPA